MKIAYVDEPPGSKIVSFLTDKGRLLKVQSVLDFACGEEVVVASPHKSKDGKPAITVHYPGNPCGAMFGGREKTLNTSNPFLAYRIYVETLRSLEEKGEGDLLTYEADHHGPTLDVPILFYEIGASEDMWNSEDYAKLMAESLEKALKSKERPAGVFLAVGGNHYARKFNDLTRKRGFAYTHILAKHTLDCIDEATFFQAVEKSLALPEGVLIDKKGTTREHKEKVCRWSENAGLDVILV